MSKQVQKRRGTSAEHSNFVGAVAEITVDTETNELVLGDGVTAGGRRVGISRVTTSDLVNSVVKYPESDVIETCGFTTAGDGGSGKWKQNGVTGQTPSQTPAQLGDGLLNDASGNQWVVVVNLSLNVKALGVKGDGVSPDNLPLEAVFNLGGRISIPKGVYMLQSTGADSNGVNVQVSKSTYVECDDGAIFVADEIDGDMIDFELNQSNSSLIHFSWSGGYFDQSQQKNSAVMPFTDIYPPENPGTSNTADGLRIALLKSNGEAGCSVVEVSNVTTYAGDHWLAGGGDSGIFISGGKILLADKITCIGARDLGIYASSSEVTDNGVICIIKDSQFLNCFHGCAGKRIMDSLIIEHCRAENCVRAFLSESIGGVASPKNIYIKDNTAVGCSVMCKVQLATAGEISGNTALSSGAVLSDNTTPAAPAGFELHQIIEANNITISKNKHIGKSDQYQSQLSGDVFNIDDSSKVLIQDNMLTDLNNTGREVGTCSDNSFIQNTVVSMSATDTFASLNNNYREERLVDNRLLHKTPVAFESSTSSSPAIYRRNQEDVGLFFNTNTVGMAVQGTARVEINSQGIGFNSKTPIQKPSVTDLAGLLVALDDYGLINDDS